MRNIITAKITDGETTVVTAEQYMYARGQILRVEGLETPTISHRYKERRITYEQEYYSHSM